MAGRINKQPGFQLSRCTVCRRREGMDTLPLPPLLPLPLRCRPGPALAAEPPTLERAGDARDARRCPAACADATARGDDGAGSAGKLQSRLLLLPWVDPGPPEPPPRPWKRRRRVTGSCSCCRSSRRRAAAACFCRSCWYAAAVRASWNAQPSGSPGARADTPPAERLSELASRAPAACFAGACWGDCQACCPGAQLSAPAAAPMPARMGEAAGSSGGCRTSGASQASAAAPSSRPASEVQESSASQLPPPPRTACCCTAARAAASRRRTRQPRHAACAWLLGRGVTQETHFAISHSHPQPADAMTGRRPNLPIVPHLHSGGGVAALQLQ